MGGYEVENRRFQEHRSHNEKASRRERHDALFVGQASCLTCLSIEPILSTDRWLTPPARQRS